MKPRSLLHPQPTNWRKVFNKEWSGWAIGTTRRTSDFWAAGSTCTCKRFRGKNEGKVISTCREDQKCPLCLPPRQHLLGSYPSLSTPQTTFEEAGSQIRWIVRCGAPVKIRAIIARTRAGDWRSIWNFRHSHMWDKSEFGDESSWG